MDGEKDASLQSKGRIKKRMDLKNINILMVIGFFGQALFSARFLVQWYVSEKQKKSVIPFSFWVLSILGSLILLIYAISKKDPVFILGQAPGVIIYARNIYLIKKRKAKNIPSEDIILKEEKIASYRKNRRYIPYKTSGRVVPYK